MQNLLDLDQQNIWHPFTPLKSNATPLLIESAEGIYLKTTDGRKIIDGISSWWVNLHGHSNTTIADAISKQAHQLEHVIFAGFTHEPAIKLADSLLKILPGNQSKIFFSDNGSTSVEVAIKLALQYWHNLGIKKKKIITLEGAYHGDTFGSMSVGERSLFTRPFQDHLFSVEFIPVPTHDNQQQVIAHLDALLKNGDIAGFIYEPLVQGASGMRIYESVLLDKILSLAKSYETILIADEVFTGFGRTGKLFASEYTNIKPDLICLSKGLTGGFMPLGVTAISQNIVDAFLNEDRHKTFFHGHSYTANPISCAAANASLELLLNPKCLENIEVISELNREFVKKYKTHKNLADIRSLGTILALELKTQEQSSYLNQMRDKIYNYFLERNILLRPLGNIFYFLPPYVINQKEITYVHEVIVDFLESLSIEPS